MNYRDKRIEVVNFAAGCLTITITEIPFYRRLLASTHQWQRTQIICLTITVIGMFCRKLQLLPLNTNEISHDIHKSNIQFGNIAKLYYCVVHFIGTVPSMGSLKSMLNDKKQENILIVCACVAIFTIYN